MSKPVERQLSGFTGLGYHKGRNALWQISWMAISGAITMRWWCPMKVRIAVLRVFGATIGDGVLIRHNVRIHWPWRLTVGDNSWIGEKVWILNLESVRIGRNVCISQGAFLCTGSHDRRSATFEFDNGPINIADGVWLATMSVVLRGVTIGHGATIGARALVSSAVEPGATVFNPQAIVVNSRTT